MFRYVTKMPPLLHLHCGLPVKKFPHQRGVARGCRIEANLHLPRSVCPDLEKWSWRPTSAGAAASPRCWRWTRWRLCVANLMRRLELEFDDVINTTAVGHAAKRQRANRCRCWSWGGSFSWCPLRSCGRPRRWGCTFPPAAAPASRPGDPSWFPAF